MRTQTRTLPVSGGVLLAALLCSTSAFAQSTPTTDPVTATTWLGRLIFGGPEYAASTSETLNQKDIVAEHGGDIDSLLRNTPGVYTRQPSSIPVTVVNIRGQQSQGRVNTMIDGVPQTMRNITGHTGTMETLTMVNSEFLTGVDIHKGAVGGEAGVGTTAGAVNFRTMNAEDVLREGEDRGGMLRLSFGTNDHSVTATTAVAQRFSFGQGGSATAMLALSGQNSDFPADGTGRTPSDYPFRNDSYLGPRTRSALAKLDVQFNDIHRLELSAEQYGTEFDDFVNGYPWDLSRETLKATYQFTPDSDLIDAELTLYQNTAEILYPEERQIPGGGSVFNGRHQENIGRGFTLKNRNTVSAFGSDVDLSYGLTWQEDDYRPVNAVTIGANAEGKLVKQAAFLDFDYEIGRLAVNGGLRYEEWETSGVVEREPCPTGLCTTAYDSRNGGGVSSRLGLTYELREGLDVYGIVSRSFRPPTASEMFMPSFHNFSGSTDATYNNLELDEEDSTSFEFGFDTDHSNVFVSGDNLQLHAGAFYSKVQGYIAYSNNVDPSDPASITNAFKWSNLDGETILKGLELSATYDSDHWFGTLSANISDVSNPDTPSAGIVGSTTRLPGRIISLDIGRKFMEGDLRLGARISYNGDYQRANFGTTTLTTLESYTTTDLYMRYQHTDDFELFANVSNLFDEHYIPSNSGAASDEYGAAGRSIKVGATWRF